MTRVELRGPILSAQAGHQLSIYCIKELFGRNSPHLASVNSSYKIYEIVVRCWAKIDVRPLHAFFVIPLLSQLWEEKNYCERRNELSSWRPVALPNRHVHLCLFMLGYNMHALLSSVMYILSGENITAVYPMSRRWWDQNTTQVVNRLNRGGIQERIVGLRFLGIILRVLRLEVSTLVLCLSTRCSSWTDLSFLHWLIVLYGFLKP